MSAEGRPKVLLVNRNFMVRDDGMLLIIQRSLDDLNYPGLWEVAGGKVEIGQDLHQAREDETLQETGLRVEVTVPVATIESKQIITGRYAGFLYLALFHVTKIVGGDLALSHEHHDHAWVTYDKLFDYNLTPEVRDAAKVLKNYLE